MALGRQIEALQYIEHLRQQHSTRTGWRHGGKLIATVISADWLAPLGFVAREIQFRDNALGRLLDVFRQLPDRQRLATLLLNQPQGRGQVLLLQQPAQRRRCAVHCLYAAGFREALERLRDVADDVAMPDAHRHAIFSQVDRRLDQFRPGQRAETLVQCPHALHEAGHCHRVLAPADVFGMLAVKLGAGGGRRRLPRIERNGRAAGRVVHHCEQPAAQPGTERMGHRGRKGGGDRRVDRVAATL